MTCISRFSLVERNSSWLTTRYLSISILYWPHTMSVGYTCQRCLRSLRGTYHSMPRLSTFKPISRNPSVKNQNVTTGLLQQKRAASSLRPQEQSVDEPVEIPTPDGLASTPVPTTVERPLLQPDNLFHLFSFSPSRQIRKRADYIKQHAFCPHPNHQGTHQPTIHQDREVKDSSLQKPEYVRFECPDCGIPVSCSEDHWADDYEFHMGLCDTLREINEDDHDLQSGRFFPEFEYPGPQMEEALVNMTNWDTFLYSREFNAINEPRSMRQATRLLTYPVTIGSVLHELSPYNIRRGGRLTVEGLKSLSGKSRGYIY